MTVFPYCPRSWFALLCGTAFLAGSPDYGCATPVEDAYLAGYAAAVVTRDFRLPAQAVQVRDQVVVIDAAAAAGVDQQALRDALARIPGVARVEIGTLPPGEALQAVAPPTPPADGSSAVRGVGAGARESSHGTFLPNGYLFDHLTADPRWPHFSVAYRYYLDETDLDSTGAANFGETLTFYRAPASFGGQWEVGIQAAVFSLFDLTAESKDLINADYMGGVFGSYRYRDFASQLRVFHQSSHLGDEFVLRNRVRERINLSYESVDLKFSYKFWKMLRLYAGGGHLFDQEPASLDPWSVQYGAEVESPHTYLGDTLRPIIAAHLNHEEENDWGTDLSLQAGVQFENWQISNRRLQILVEYFAGHSPNGQFYKRHIKTIGLGAHLRF